MFCMQKGDGVVIIDAGGGTIDISSYSKNITRATKGYFEEIVAPQCREILPSLVLP